MKIFISNFSCSWYCQYC